MLYCPNCNVRVAETFKFCRECGYKLNIEVPLLEVSEQAQSAVGMSEAKCADHPERDAVGTCVDCGKGVCFFCRTVLGNNSCCPSCIDIRLNPAPRVGIKEQDLALKVLTPLYAEATPLMQRAVLWWFNNKTYGTDTNEIEEWIHKNKLMGMELNVELLNILEAVKEIPKPKQKELHRLQKDFEKTLSLFIAANDKWVEMIEGPYIRKFDSIQQSKDFFMQHGVSLIDLTQRAIRNHELLIQGMLDAGVPESREALSIDANDADVHYKLGNAYSDEGKLDEAVAEYRKALSIDPNYANAHNNLGATYTEQGNLDEAVAEFRMALIIDPDDVDAHYNLGNAYRDQGKLDEAVAEYREMLRVDPKDADARKSLGELAQPFDIDEIVKDFHVT